MSKYIKVYPNTGIYGGFANKVDYDRLIAAVVAPVIRQHIPDDGRLKATLEAVSVGLTQFIDKYGEEEYPAHTIKEQSLTDSTNKGDE